MKAAPPNYPLVIAQRILRDIPFRPQPHEQTRIVKQTCSSLGADQRHGVLEILNTKGHQKLVKAFRAMTAPVIPEACREREQRETD